MKNNFANDIVLSDGRIIKSKNNEINSSEGSKETNYLDKFALERNTRVITRLLYNRKKAFKRYKFKILHRLKLRVDQNEYHALLSNQEVVDFYAAKDKNKLTALDFTKLDISVPVPIAEFRKYKVRKADKERYIRFVTTSFRAVYDLIQNQKLELIETVDLCVLGYKILYEKEKSSNDKLSILFTSFRLYKPDYLRFDINDLKAVKQVEPSQSDTNSKRVKIE